MTALDFFTANIHAMRCTNRCQHCWTQGSARNRQVPAEQVFFVLEKLAEARTQAPQGAFFLYDEPTTHPQFIKIIERAAALGLMWEDFFLPTNGSVLAGVSNQVMQRLKAASVNCLQLTAYGLEQTHDEFAVRRGAFQNFLATIRRAMEHGLEWYAGVVLHAGSVAELPQVFDLFRSLDPSGKATVGSFPFSWQGRGRYARRARASDYARLPDEYKRPAFVSEAQAVNRILADPQLSGKRAGSSVCYGLGVQVDRDLRVYCGGTCDSAGILAAAPELAAEFYLGTLGEQGFLPMLDAFQQERPRGLQLLEAISWGELAGRYGDRANDEIYYLDDLPEVKWAAGYLPSALPSRQ